MTRAEEPALASMPGAVQARPPTCRRMVLLLQVSVDAEVFGGQLAFLSEGLELELNFYDGVPVTAELPAQVGGWDGGWAPGGGGGVGATG